MRIIKTEVTKIGRYTVTDIFPDYTSEEEWQEFAKNICECLMRDFKKKKKTEDNDKD